MAKGGEWCPLIQKDCKEHKCAWYIQVQGTDPQTGADISDWRCAIAWMPIMSIEIASKANQTGAAVESFRNEVVKANEINQQLYIAGLEQQGIVPSQVTPMNPPMIPPHPPEINPSEQELH